MSEDEESRRTLKLKAAAPKPPADPRAPRRPPVRPRGPARARPLSESARPDLPVQPAATASAPGLPEGAPRPPAQPPARADFERRGDFSQRGAARPAGPRSAADRPPAPRSRDERPSGPRAPGSRPPAAGPRDERAPRAPGQWTQPARPRDDRGPSRGPGAWGDAPRSRDDRAPAPRKPGGWGDAPRSRDDRAPAPRKPGAWGEAPRSRDDRAPAPRAPGQWTKPTRPRDDRPAAPRGAGPRDAAAPRRSPARPAPAPAVRAPAFPPGAPREGVRLNKRLSEMGLCSRREGDEWIEKGWVLVNGAVAVMGQPVTESDHIEVLPQAQHAQGERVTILLHKPVGYVSGQAEDGHEAAVSLFNARTHWREDPSERRFSPAQYKGLAPAGRLDIDSTGLLVLTQDGRVARQLIGEDSEIDKEYLVRVHWAPNGPQGEGLVTEDVQSVFPEDRLALLRHGLSLDEQPLKPAQVEWLNPEQLRFVLVEGKKRQIRRMCEQVGLHVVGLKRVRMGRVLLGQLPQGQWRYLGEDEAF